ncbi:DNA/RNA helicase domain-containing protein [Lichenicoccus roseus]|uniref:DUF2075 domain-containing protein n=1 Tax=Lichenicoccus roseus TaxID=2683649 RepID=A0A5R9J1Z9_9PROT|nr:DNA/RNA helicase domain-containing protein [Lichenicoccus roseus]TLU70883.1 DUF2075 domain-containing protein [Lichenicoccus roseus]
MNHVSPNEQTASGAWWSDSVALFLAAAPADLLGRLAHAATRHHRINEATQLRAWQRQIAILRETLLTLPQSRGWRLLLEFEIPRFRRRIDAVLLAPAGIFVLEFKVGATAFTDQDRQQVADYALDLQDFHAGSRRHPILPILIATEAVAGPQTLPFAFDSSGDVLDADPGSLPGLLQDLARLLPNHRRALDMPGWESAAYRPVPNVIDAARILFSRQGVAEILSARSDATNLTLTTDRIAALMASARADRRKVILFVTGIPGAGKTLCGLNAAFTVETGIGAAFLTGNPTLVHVLREALVRDAIAQGEKRAPAAHRIKGVIQALPAFRDLHVRTGEVPAERVVVIDEAQRCWDATQAVGKTRDRPVQLSTSEPAHLLDIMARHDDFAAMICLIGNGQEIHDGEGGLAEWGDALRIRPEWRVFAAPATLAAAEPRNRLPALPGMVVEPALHLNVPVRSLRHNAAPDWVDAVLRGDAGAARAIITREGDVPFRLTRSLSALRDGLRSACRGSVEPTHRAGLICSAGARRLRAEGLGAELPHMEADAVARWFLDRYPADVRASDALEQVATQFSVQGLELDHVGLCWDADLIRMPGEMSGETGWRVRSFSGTDWQVRRDAEKIAYRINTYRVLLTRARYQTIIWVPAGDAADRTRDPTTLDGIAAFLRSCGVLDLAAPARPNQRQAVPSPQLLLA